MYPHRIRLRGPWACEPIFRFTADGQRATDDLRPAYRFTMPGRCQQGFPGGVRFTRRFGYPGRIDETERVWLTLAGMDGMATVSLNNTPLGALDATQGPAEFDITALLRPRNELRVELESHDAPAGLWGDVALEVRATAFLSDVCFECHANQLTARGLVVGSAARPLELYLFAGSRFLTYDRIEPSASGQPFVISGELEGSPSTPLPVRVELVDTAVIWYVVSGFVSPGQSNPSSVSS
ncbi:MAG TPA: hypothetical protein VE988_24410 [Gemmataceae bacterium]|nr:hypothetical protein [Gemmataceae bacterium]